MSTQQIITTPNHAHHLGKKPLPEQPTGLDLIQHAVINGASIEVIERLFDLQQKMTLMQAEREFDEALSRCQAKLSRIAADSNNPQTRSRYASYAKIDSIVRPIYTAEGFSLSFTERDCPTPGKTRFVGRLSRAGYTREYLKDMTPSTQGPKGNDVMTAIHADASADSYAKRYLVKDIFNVAIGEDDNDGNDATEPRRIPEARVKEFCERMNNCANEATLRNVFRAAYSEAEQIADRNAQKTYIAVKDARKAAIQ
jgi:hypothetical protein